MSTLLRNIAMTLATVWMVAVAVLSFFNIDFHTSFGVFTLFMAGMLFFVVINWSEALPQVVNDTIYLYGLSVLWLIEVQNPPDKTPIYLQALNWGLWYCIICFLTKKVSTLLRNRAITLATVWMAAVAVLPFFNIDFHVFGVYFQFCTLLIAGILSLVKRRERCTK